MSYEDNGSNWDFSMEWNDTTPKQYGYYQRCKNDSEKMKSSLQNRLGYCNSRYTLKVFSDREGKRDEWNELMKICKEGDTIVIPNLERLSPSIEGLRKIIKQIKKSGVYISSLEYGTPSIEKLVYFVEVYDLYEKISQQRQRDGIEQSKKKGKYKGRKPLPTPDNYSYHIKRWESGKEKTYECISNLHMSTSTFYRKYKRYKDKKENKIKEG